MIIAFAGFKGSGKSKATQVLVEHGYYDVKMAAPLKSMLHAMYTHCDLDDDEIERRLEGDLKETPDPWLQGQTPRHAMQQLGTEWRNSISKHLWIPMWEKTIELLGNQPICCSDIRFEHEVEALKRQGGALIWISRPGKVSETHDSEQDISHLADITIINDGTVEQLHQQIEELL